MLDSNSQDPYLLKADIVIVYEPPAKVAVDGTKPYVAIMLFKIYVAIWLLAWFIMTSYHMIEALLPCSYIVSYIQLSRTI